jgi:hypothetical protein
MCDPTDAAAGPPPRDALLEAIAEAALAEVAHVHDDTPARDEAERGDESAAEEGADDEVVEPVEATDADAARGSRTEARFTIYTARYRLQLKGPDRGKWEVEVVAEADAPLLTVDAVVRGVQRRVGDAAEVERLTGEDVQRLLDGPP